MTIINKKNALAVALVAGLGLAGTAGAYTYWTAGNITPENIATSQVSNALTVINMTEAVQIRVDTGDLIIGRTTGFQVRIDLGPPRVTGTRAIFNNLLVGTQVAIGTNPRAPGSALPAGWRVTVAAGGTNADFAVFNVTPPNVQLEDGIGPGELFRLDSLALRDVEELAVVGGRIDAQFFFADSVGAAIIGDSLKPLTLLVAGIGQAFTCDASAGDVASRIDVADTTATGGGPSKTRFSPTGVIGGGSSLTFDFGNISVSRAATFPNFNYALETDSFTTVLTGSPGDNFNAFTSIFLSTNNCASAVTNGGGVILGNTVTFNYRLENVGGGGAGFTAAVCGRVNGTSLIDDVFVGNPPVINATTTFNRGTTSVIRPACPLLPLLYNGSIVEIYHINPAGNSTAQSFVRVINRSTTGGRVTLQGIDDNGNPSAQNVTFNLLAGRSMQVNSEDLERGNVAKGLTGAWGDGTGKWRSIVTAEFPGVRVQGLNRNANDGTVTNLTDADGRGEQVMNSLFDNN